MNRRELTGEDPGRIHMPGIGYHDSETLCGCSWSGNTYESVSEPADCPLCLGTAEEVWEILTAQKRAGLWPPPKPTPADDVRLMSVFQARVAELGLSGNAVSKLIGINQSCVARVLRGSTTRLRSRTREAIEQFLAGTGET